MIKFYKYHALGNDFVILDQRKDPSFRLNQKQIEQLAHRQFGVGFDQLLILKPSFNAHFCLEIFDNDGSEVEMCGNGIRAAALFYLREGGAFESEILVQTLSGIQAVKPLQWELNKGEFEVKMPTPTFKGKVLENYYPVSMGNPHAVRFLEVNEIALLEDRDFLSTEGKRIETHALFPEGVNVGFVQVLSEKEINLRVWERASGLTYACGSGACAAVAIGIKKGLLDPSEVRVHFQKGLLTIRWPNQSEGIFMRGPAQFVFEGIFDPSFLL